MIDAQEKGLEEINALILSKQTRFFKSMQIESLMTLGSDALE